MKTFKYYKVYIFIYTVLLKSGFVIGDNVVNRKNITICLNENTSNANSTTFNCVEGSCYFNVVKKFEVGDVKFFALNLMAISPNGKKSIQNEWVFPYAVIFQKLEEWGFNVKVVENGFNQSNGDIHAKIQS